MNLSTNWNSRIGRGMRNDRLRSPAPAGTAGRLYPRGAAEGLHHPTAAGGAGHVRQIIAKKMSLEQ